MFLQRFNEIDNDRDTGIKNLSDRFLNYRMSYGERKIYEDT